MFLRLPLFRCVCVSLSSSICLTSAGLSVQAKYTALEIDSTRKSYTSAAKRGSILFFVLSGLSTVNKMCV